ncbi:MAG: hypothetical protein ACR2LV_02360 [Solirubrobacteraceae bacterium]
MSAARTAGVVALTLVASASANAARPSPASALNPLKPICGAAGLVSGMAGKACHALQHVGKLAKAGGKLITGHPGAALSTLEGTGTGATTALGLAAIVTWVLGGAKFALHLTAKVLAQTTSPRLGSTWFSSAYWRIAAVAAVLTLPFLFAATVQALMHSDLSLLARAVLGYLPLAMLAISVAAPITMLLLAASDQLSAIVSAAAGNSGEDFLGRAWGLAGGLTILSGSPFVMFLVGLFTAASAIMLWLELAVREAAVYVVVLMLPIAFAALAWPARRVWAVRAVELLVALILSKFAIVAVLALGGAALEHASTFSVTTLVAGAALVAIGAFAPWAMLRLLPLSELASGTAGALRPGTHAMLRPALHHTGMAAHAGTGWIEHMTGAMRDMAPTDPVQDASESAADSRTRQLGETLPGALRAPGSPSTASQAGPTDQESGAQAIPAPQPPSGLASDPPATAAGTGRDEARAVADGSPPSSQPGPEPDLGEADAGTDRGGETSERLPGMAPMWQAADLSWTPLTLGPQGWPPPRLWPPEGQDDSGLTGGEPGGDRDADDPDPRPPKQPPPGAGP